jgi:AraC-like DNA-binding protein
MAAPVACRVLYANQLVIDQRWSWRLSDPFWRLYFNRDRGAWIGAGRRRWDLREQRAALVPAWGDFRGACIGPVRHFYIHFETPGLSAEWIRKHLREPLLLADDPALRAMLDQLAAEATPLYPVTGADGRWRVPDRPAQAVGAPWLLRAEAAAAWALAAGLAVADPAAVAELAGRRPDDDLEPALAEVDARLHEPLTIARLARRCGLSADHFARRFTRSIGRTPMRYVQERRIAAAAERLINSGAPIEEISRRSGFANRFHFSRVFARLIGTPPAQYRRQHRK